MRLDSCEKSWDPTNTIKCLKRTFAYTGIFETSDIAHKYLDIFHIPEFTFKAGNRKKTAFGH